MALDWFGSGLAWAFQTVPIAVVLAYLPFFVKTFCQLGSNFSGVAPRKNPVPDGLAFRADGCHANQLEMLPLYCSGILAATMAGVDSAIIAMYATRYVVARILYIVVYLTGEEKLPTKGLLRTTLWAFGCLSPSIMLWTEAAKSLV
eukprot:Plantae.Rhodophyta-Rhodochaete_pulchella.ctg3283.p1 GENE.Plantae.Rhodophyta-Rhodochaete_pulchella.ctg3283~~Plantae.Rhodophyta-Rhodochaete_pulchella.ctg3283.p1  ORF type:complete len:146 (+),score=13.34 Plantae.Rhodophyta-Rhodochaete_pulchella.ctg3283:345-782(+)